ncbi:Uncharacterised protein [Chryseobacterium taihuense]|jgi:hypothetical protein|nr:Uncharacterised protein [Chryseobacterium taihuense]
MIMLVGDLQNASVITFHIAKNLYFAKFEVIIIICETITYF